MAMFEHFSWLPLLLALTALTLAPGVDTLLVLRNTTRGGGRDGLLTGLGICSGLFVHALISAAGLSMILLGSAELFMLLKLAGAAYLVWLGIQSLRSAMRRRGMTMESVAPQQVAVKVSLREGALSNLLNPKPIVFYMAFLPQFIDPSHPAVPQALLIAALHFLLAMGWYLLLVVLIGWARRWLQQPKVAAWLDGISGLVLMGFGWRLANSQ
ncbi:LysE family translocator [Motiliproteus coralliicola]